MMPSVQRAVVGMTATLLLTTACTSGEPVGPVTVTGNGTVAGTTSTRAAAAVDFQYQAQEVDIRFTAQPDGTLSVMQTAVVDAGPGVTGTVAVHVKKKLRITTSDDPRGWYWVAPAVGVVSARDTTTPGAPQQLPAAVIDTDHSWRVVAAADRVFSAGRHRIELSYTISGLLTTSMGHPVLIAPQGVIGAGWYSFRGTGDLARFTAAGGATLGCGDEDRGVAEPNCPTNRGGTVFVMSDLDNGSTTSGGANGYFFLMDPPGVTATPVEAQFETRS